MKIITLYFLILQIILGLLPIIHVSSEQQNKTNSVQCPKSRYCMPSPWCRSSVDSNGCKKCTCSMGGFGGQGRSGFVGMSRPQNSFPGMSSMSSMQGSGMGGFPGFPSFNGQSSMMNPMAAMFNQMGGGQMNGHNAGFNSLTGPSGIGTGTLPNSNKPVLAPNNTCDPAPFTCTLPPPWCQRIVNSHGCVICYCGKDLQKYLQSVEIGNTETTTTVQTTSQKETTTFKSTPEVSTTPLTTQKTTTSCLDNFFCTKICDNGYMTDTDGCPMCQCIQSGSSGILTTIAPVVYTDTTVTSDLTTRPSDGTILCPGIFDCTLMCMSGYQIDAQGCPLCKCIDGS